MRAGTATAPVGEVVERIGCAIGVRMGAILALASDAVVAR